MKKRSFIYFGLFIGTLMICVCFLFLTSLIPTKVINFNLKSSVTYIMNERQDNKLFFLPDNLSATLDNYADYMTIKMLYYVDSKHPIISSLHMNCYDDLEDFTFGAAGVVNGRRNANFSYSRYWHGNLAILRILFVFFDIQGIQIVFSLLLGILLVLLLTILLKKRCYLLSGLILFSFFATYSFVVPFCFEFYWMYFIGFLFAIFSALSYKKASSFIYGIFVVMGVVVNFFDFLTTEMLVPLFSLLLIIYLKRRDEDEMCLKDLIFFVSISLMLFVLFYSLTWFVKWSISNALFGLNIFELLSSQGWKWTGGLGSLKYVDYPVLSTLIYNISKLFPFKYILNDIGIVVYLLIIVLIIVFKIIRKEFSKYSFIYLLLFFVPYIRYIVLLGHSYLHSFFTYRSQFTSIIFLFLILFEKKDKTIRSK